MTSEAKGVIVCVDVFHSHIWPYHGSAILIGGSADSLAILFVFEQCIHAFSNGVGILRTHISRRHR